MNSKNIIGVVLFSIFAVVGLVVLFGSWTTINQTQRGVVLRLGEVVRVLEPGFNWKKPFIEDVKKMQTSTQIIEVAAKASSRDLQDVDSNIAVQYFIDPLRVADVYAEYKTSVRTIVIDPAIQDAMKAATAQFNAEELITKRSEVKELAFQLLKERLAEAHIIATNLDIVDFRFSDSFNLAIEAKVKAEQQALEQVNITRQEEEKKKQEILKAEAIAEKTRLEVRALAAGSDLIEKIRAEAQLEAATNWNGVLPTHMVPGGALPFLDLNTY